MWFQFNKALFTSCCHMVWTLSHLNISPESLALFRQACLCFGEVTFARPLLCLGGKSYSGGDKLGASGLSPGAGIEGKAAESWAVTAVPAEQGFWPCIRAAPIGVPEGFSIPYFAGIKRIYIKVVSLWQHIWCRYIGLSKRSWLLSPVYVVFVCISEGVYKLWTICFLLRRGLPYWGSVLGGRKEGRKDGWMEGRKEGRKWNLNTESMIIH